MTVKIGFGYCEVYPALIIDGSFKEDVDESRHHFILEADDWAARHIQYVLAEYEKIKQQLDELSDKLFDEEDVVTGNIGGGSFTIRAANKGEGNE